MLACCEFVVVVICGRTLELLPGDEEEEEASAVLAVGESGES